MNTSKSKQFLSKMMTGLAGNNKQPTANIKSVELEDYKLFESFTLLAKVSVHNPYCFSIPNCEITFSLKSIGSEVAHGIIKLRSLKANDDTLVDFRVTALLIDGLKTLYKDIMKDWDIDYALDLTIVVDVPFITCCKKTIHLPYKGELKLPATLSDVIKII